MQFFRPLENFTTPSPSKMAALNRMHRLYLWTQRSLPWIKDTFGLTDITLLSMRQTIRNQFQQYSGVELSATVCFSIFHSLFLLGYWSSHLSWLYWAWRNSPYMVTTPSCPSSFPRPRFRSWKEWNRKFSHRSGRNESSCSSPCYSFKSELNISSLPILLFLSVVLSLFSTNIFLISRFLLQSVKILSSAVILSVVRIKTCQQSQNTL